MQEKSPASLTELRAESCLTDRRRQTANSSEREGGAGGSRGGGGGGGGGERTRKEERGVHQGQGRGLGHEDEVEIWDVEWGGERGGKTGGGRRGRYQVTTGRAMDQW
eukprot:766602-Hanusia_phi.AAC.1